GRRLMPRPYLDPNPDRQGTHGVHVLADHGQAGRKLDPAKPIPFVQRPSSNQNGGRGLRWTWSEPLFDGALAARVLRLPPGALPAAARRPALCFVVPGLLVSRERLLAAQLDLAFAVDPDHLDQDRVPFVDDVLDPLHAVRLELRDVDQAVFARGDFDEGPERHHPAHDPRINAPDLGVLGDRSDDVSRPVPVRPAERCDADFAGVVDVDLGPR